MELRSDRKVFLLIVLSGTIFYQSYSENNLIQSTPPTLSFSCTGAKDSTNNNNSSSATSLSKKRSDDNKPYEYNMVRTDSRSQTLDAFLMPGAARGSAAATAAASDVVVVGSKTSGSTAAGAAAAGSSKRKGAEPEMEWDPIRQRMRPAKKVV